MKKTFSKDKNKKKESEYGMMVQEKNVYIGFGRLGLTDSQLFNDKEQVSAST